MSLLKSEDRSIQNNLDDNAAPYSISPTFPCCDFEWNILLEVPVCFKRSEANNYSSSSD